MLFFFDDKNRIFSNMEVVLSYQQNWPSGVNHITHIFKFSSVDVKVFKSCPFSFIFFYLFLNNI